MHCLDSGSAEGVGLGLVGEDGVVVDGANVSLEVLELREGEDLLQEDRKECREAESALLLHGYVVHGVPGLLQWPSRKFVLDLFRARDIRIFHEQVAQQELLLHSHCEKSKQ